MKSVHRKGVTNKRTATRREKGRDVESAEGGSVVDRIVDGLLGPVKARDTMLAAELGAVAESLGVALGDIVEAYTQDDSQAFTEALRRVQSARVVLQGEATKLLEVQP